MPKKFQITFIGFSVLALTLAFFAPIMAEETKVQIDNEYIRIVVNNSVTNTGRFSVGTTGGDPDRVTDRNQHLIYGGDDPWTSYTTVRVGNQNYIYGNPTDKRAGFSGLYGEIVQEPTIVDDSIQSSWMLGPIQVWQVLSLTRSSTTGLLDTARIEYHVENTDDVSHMVGLRLMLDTMLGANDGAPFRVEDRGLTSDTVYYAQDMPTFWQAFDSLANPRVMSQGTLTGQDVTTPDRVYFTNWGSLADNVWNFDFTPGRDFTRIGEFELDSAIALFWDSLPLAPGESRSYVSYYGLGGVTIAPGDLAVGVTSPAEITSTEDGFQTFSVVAYVQNTGEGDARDVVAEIKLPKGLELVGSPAQVKLSDLAVNDTKQAGWQVRAENNADGSLTYEVEVTAINSKPNRVQRAVRILSPANLRVLFEGPPALNVKNERYDPPYFEAQARIRNDGGTASYGGVFEIQHPIGLDLVSGQNAKKFARTIEPGQEVVFNWLLKPRGGISGTLPYSIRVTSENAPQDGRNNFIIVPELKPKIWIDRPVKSGSGEIEEGDYFSLSVWATNIHDFIGANLDLTFAPEHLEIVGKTLDISTGTLFIDEQYSPARPLGWTMPKVSNASGEVQGLKGDRGEGNALALSYGTLVTIHFRAKTAGISPITINGLQVFTKQGVMRDSDLEVSNTSITIHPKK